MCCWFLSVLCVLCTGAIVIFLAIVVRGAIVIFLAIVSLC